MSQEKNIISTSATSAVELANNKHKIIYKNIQTVNHPIKFSFNSFGPKLTFSRSRFACFVFKREYEALHKHAFLKSTISKLATEKWNELSDDARRVYLNFSSDAIEYNSYKTRSLTYQLIKF
ncbi:unnamed protein product [Rhizophagus irregularis]|uniref:HMG box domain-containing protein n=1 Tax=Rhizophagus irregularis TaxID=588596 RepID=A0A2N1N1Q5_9GLOM|nr:hypothetical protein RhiirC2_751220 [Rhizophagus irregularis]CAB4377939.1 unnamed protein product [Rhizophagus irregularis]CAB5359708.1 unnamed protein product [Rhizophagus irregularis]